MTTTPKFHALAVECIRYDGTNLHDIRKLCESWADDLQPGDYMVADPYGNWTRWSARTFEASENCARSMAKLRRTRMETVALICWAVVWVAVAFMVGAGR